MNLIKIGDHIVNLDLLQRVKRAGNQVNLYFSATSGSTDHGNVVVLSGAEAEQAWRFFLSKAAVIA